jgi:hypothetical protein
MTIGLSCDCHELRLLSTVELSACLMFTILTSQVLQQLNDAQKTGAPKYIVDEARFSAD